MAAEDYCDFAGCVDELDDSPSRNPRPCRKATELLLGVGADVQGFLELVNPK